MYLKFSKDLAYKAGDIMKKHFGFGINKEYKGDGSPVTIADKEINTMVINAIKGKFPEHDVLGEEESHLVNDSDYVWICDPIDGTIPYSHAMPMSTFALALTYKGEVILGVIYDPFYDRIVYAEKGSGAFLNGKKVSVSDSGELGNRNIIHEENRNGSCYDLSTLLIKLYSKGVAINQYCSVFYGGIFLVTGSIIGIIFPHTTCHDAAPLKVILEEAGGKMTDLYGEEQRYDRPIKGYIASNGVLHDELVELSKKYVKKRIC